jgi:predicted dinucleotide-binding enzyme
MSKLRPVRASVVIAVPFSAQAGILKTIKGAVKQAILVDASVPLAATSAGGRRGCSGVGRFGGAAGAGLVPGVPVVSAFHNVSAEMLHDLTLTLDCDILICGDEQRRRRGCRPW